MNGSDGDFVWEFNINFSFRPSSGKWYGLQFLKKYNWSLNIKLKHLDKREGFPKHIWQKKHNRVMIFNIFWQLLSWSYAVHVMMVQSQSLDKLFQNGDALAFQSYLGVWLGEKKLLMVVFLLLPLFFQVSENVGSKFIRMKPRWVSTMYFVMVNSADRMCQWWKRWRSGWLTECLPNPNVKFACWIFLELQSSMFLSSQVPTYFPSKFPDVND